MDLKARIEADPNPAAPRDSAQARAKFESVLLLFAKNPSQTEYRQLMELLWEHPERMSLAHWACSLIERTPEIRDTDKSLADPAAGIASGPRLMRALYCEILDIAGYQNLSVHKQREWGLASQPPRTPSLKSDSTDRRTLTGRLAVRLDDGEPSLAEVAALRLLDPERAYHFGPAASESGGEVNPNEPVRDHFIDLDRDEFRTPASPHLQLGIPLEWRAAAIVHILSGVLSVIPRSLVIDLLWDENTRRTHLEMRMQKLLERLQKKHGLGVHSVSHRTRGAPAPQIELTEETRARIEIRIRGRP
jgi:hypothetical protein